MVSENNRISLKQVRKMLIFDLISIPGLVIPSIATATAGRDGFISVIAGTVLAYLYAIVLLFFSKNMKEEFVDYSNKAVGKFLTILFSILYFVKLYVSLLFCITLLGNIIQDTFLEDTNFKVIIGFLILVGAYTSYKGIEVRARVTEFLFYIIVVPITILLILGLKKVDLNNLAPLFTESGTNVLNSSYCILLAYSAIDFLIFTVPLAVDSKKTKLKIHWTIGLVGLLNVLIYIVTVGNIGVAGVGKKLWSTVTVMQIIEMPGGFIQRQDGVMLAFWMLCIFTTISMLLFLLSYLTQKVLKRKDYQYFILPYAVIAFFIAATEFDLNTMFKYYGMYMAYIGLPQSIIIPFFIILINKAKKNKGAGTING